MKIALDAMGGDFAPKNPIAGAVEALATYNDFSLTLVGDEPRVRAEVSKHSLSQETLSRIGFVHTTQVVEMNESGIQSVRRKKDSSISRSVDLIKKGEAEAVVSAGHTGALVAASIIKLRTLPGIDRPGLAVLMPTKTHVFLLIDAGATIDPDPEQILGYAVMGSIYSREVLGSIKPRVGLLSIGSEASKGNEFTKECFKLLSEAPINFAGNTEGHDLFSNPVEIVVCDGFVGNIVLKTSESLAKSIFGWLKSELHATPVRKLGAFLAREAFDSIKRRTNTDEYGGSPLLGVNGICIKAHGNSSPLAMKNAIRVARESIRHQINPIIIAEMKRHRESLAKN